MEERRMLAGGLAATAAAAGTTTAQGLNDPNWYYVQSLSGTFTHLTLGSGQVARLKRMLDLGASPQQVVTRMLDLTQTLRTEVSDAYRQLLGRAPTAGEMAGGLSLLRGGRDQRAVMANVLGSADYYARAGGSDASFVGALYQQVLGRAPAAEEASAMRSQLASGASRRHVAAQLMSSPEGLAAMAAKFQAIPISASAVPDAGTAAKLLSRPDGLRRMEAQVFGSGAYYSLVSAVPASTPSPAGQPLDAAVPGLPLGQQWDLGTRWTLLTESSSGTRVTAIDAATDGTVWEGVEPYTYNGAYSEVSFYNPQTGNQATYGYLHGTVTSIAAVAPNAAWVVTSQGKGYEITYSNGLWQLGDMPPLPGGEGFALVSQSYGNTQVSNSLVWAEGTSGAVYSTVNGSPWTLQPYVSNLSAISVGSSSNIWGLGQYAGVGAPVEHLVGNTFQVDPFFSDKGGAASIGATTDGAAWAVGGDGHLYRWTASSNAWAPVTGQTPPGPLSALAGVSQYRLDAVYPVAYYPGSSQATSPLELLTFGIADQPATGFPALTPEEQIAYTYISQQVLITSDPGASIRAHYDDPNDMSKIASWPDAIKSLGRSAPPPGVSASVWASLTNQLAIETSNVAAVINLFSQLHTFVDEVAIATEPLLGAAGDLVDLTNQQTSNSTVAVVFEDLFEAALAGLVAVPTGGGAIVAAVVASGLNSAIAAATANPNPDDTTAVVATIAALEQDISSIYTGTNTADGTLENAILSDYGRFTTVGAAVNNNSVTWNYDTVPQLAAQAVSGFNRYFYQVLVPIRWQLHAYNGTFDDYIYDDIPSYDVYFLSSTFGSDNFLEYGNFRWIQDPNANESPWDTSGPFPTQALISSVYQAGVTPDQLFRSSSGFGWNKTFWYTGQQPIGP